MSRSGKRGRAVPAKHRHRKGLRELNQRNAQFWEKQTALFLDRVQERPELAVVAASNATSLPGSMESHLERLVRENPKPGRRGPKKKAAIFKEAKRMHGAGMPWPAIAKQLDRKGFKENPRKAAEAMRKGCGRIKN